MRVASFFVVLAALNVSTGCAKPALSRQRVPRSPLGQGAGSIGQPNEIKVPSRIALDTNIEVSGGQAALPVGARDGGAAPLALFIPPTPERELIPWLRCDPARHASRAQHHNPHSPDG